ncbi:MAG: GNAT family N-acetyltransferase [Bacteroidales bacterium]|nr:GNAT family N-acetyltransferase [Bacteroidales bacterium]
METIIEPIDKALIRKELTPDKKLRDTNKGHNEIYVVTWQDSPEIVKEIGRLREVAFRTSGGGSGLSMDLDIFDTMEEPYRQLIVWDPDAEAILGGYRYILGSDVKLDEKGQPILATSHMFHFSDKFIHDYLPYTIELGRSFVAPEYQSSKAGAKALYALDNLWDGLAAVMFSKPGMKHFFGKMTMYPSYDRYGRDLILYFLDKHFGDKEHLVEPYKPLILENDWAEMGKVLNEEDFKKDYKILNAEVRKLGCNIPPLVNSYMNLSPTMKMFGTAINDEFSDVEETGILVTLDEMYEEKRARHIDSFLKQKIEKIKIRFPLFAESHGNRLGDLFKERRKKTQEKMDERKKHRIFQKKQ